MEDKGLSIEQVGRLTEYQAMILAGAFCPEDGRLKLTPEQARLWKQRKGS